MQNRPRRALALLLPGLVIAALLAACGDATATPSTSTTVAVGTAASATTAAAVATTVAPVATTAAVAPATTAAVATTAASVATTAAVAPATTAASAAAAPGSTVACDKPVAAASNGKSYRIGIAVQNSIPALLNAINGFKKGMEQCGFVEGKNVKYDLGNALGDIPSLTTIGKKFADDKVDMIAAIGTQALVAMYNTNKDNATPIVFNSVTDPYAALKEVIKSPTDHSFMTGIQALAPVEDAMKLILEIVPTAKNVGLVYNPSETNSKISRDQALDVASKLGLKLVDASITGSGDVLPAAQSLADKVDVFFSTTDVTVVNAFESLVKVATDGKKPLVANDPDSGSRGAVAALGLDYFDNGVASGGKAAQILDGKKVQEVAIDRQKKGFLTVNLKAAEQMGVKLPDAVTNRADQKFTEIKPK